MVDDEREIRRLAVGNAIHLRSCLALAKAMYSSSAKEPSASGRGNDSHLGYFPELGAAEYQIMVRFMQSVITIKQLGTFERKAQLYMLELPRAYYNPGQIFTFYFFFLTFLPSETTQ